MLQCSAAETLELKFLFNQFDYNNNNDNLSTYRLNLISHDDDDENYFTIPRCLFALDCKKCLCLCEI